MTHVLVACDKVMKNSNLLKKLTDHLIAIQCAFGIVAVGLLVYMPKGIHSIDLSTSDRKSYLFGIEQSLLKIFEGDFSTIIHEIDGYTDKHEWFGFPRVAIVDPGVHELKLYCSWSRFGNTWNRQTKQFTFTLRPDTVYAIESASGAEFRSLNEKCQIELRIIESSEYQLIPKYQLTVLSQYGVGDDPDEIVRRR